MLISQRWKNPATIGARVIELVSIALAISGFLWSTSDLLILHVLVEAPVAPLSVLFMLYGTLGAFVSEVTARWLSRGTNPSEKNR